MPKKEIELIPCIQTLAHLNTMFKWSSEYECIRDCDDVLLADEERTYTLIDNMFKTISKCFKSKKYISEWTRLIWSVSESILKNTGMKSVLI